MQDEMKRLMAELRLKGEAPPYYIAYEVLDRTMTDVAGRLGAIVETQPRRTRTLRVEVRVGDYAFDSSRFVIQGLGGGVGLTGETAIAPLDDDYDAMRREIWIMTDMGMRAISMFARKKAAFQNRNASDPIPDYSQEPPVETILPGTIRPRSETADTNYRSVDGSQPRLQSDPAIITRVQPSSAVFGAYSDIDLSEVPITQVLGTRYYLNSEGFKTVAPIQIASLPMYAEVQAPDGMPVRQTFSAGRACGRRPAGFSRSRRPREVAGGRCDSLRAAAIGEEFAGPVLIEGVGAAQFIAETIVQMMQARRPPDTENPRMGQIAPSPF